MEYTSLLRNNVFNVFKNAGKNDTITITIRYTETQRTLSTGKYGDTNILIRIYLRRRKTEDGGVDKQHMLTIGDMRLSRHEEFHTLSLCHLQGPARTIDPGGFNHGNVAGCVLAGDTGTRDATCRRWKRDQFGSWFCK